LCRAVGNNPHLIWGNLRRDPNCTRYKSGWPPSRNNSTHTPGLGAWLDRLKHDAFVCDVGEYGQSRGLSGEEEVVPSSQLFLAFEILRLVSTGSCFDPAGRLDQPGLFLIRPVTVPTPAFMVGKVQ